MNRPNQIKTRYRLFSVRLHSKPVQVTIRDTRNGSSVTIPAPVRQSAPDVARRYLRKRGIHVSAVAMIDPGEASPLTHDGSLSEVCLLSRDFETPIVRPA